MDSRSEEPAVSRPSQALPGPPVEAMHGRNIARRAIVVGPLIIAAFVVLRGVEGGAAAGIGVLVVVANFALAGVLLTRAATISATFYHAAALFGFFIRLGLITAAMLLIAWVVDVDRLAMGLAAVIGYLVLLTLEAWAVLRGDDRKEELEWTG